MRKSGYVSILGRPNVGKSTLMNRLIGQKLTITSDRAQTTRHRILGVLTVPNLEAQLLFLDSPGYLLKTSSPMDHLLNRTARAVSVDADILLFVCDARGFTDSDKRIIQLLPKIASKFLVINKVDRVNSLMERWSKELAEIQAIYSFDEIVPVSAKTGYQIDLLISLCAKKLPESDYLFEEDTLTDRSERFLSAERVREKIFQQLGDELPYNMTVIVESFKEIPSRNLRCIDVAIIVKRESQKAIVLGAGGSRIKKIAMAARCDLEKMFGGKIFLKIFVKVVSGWADSEALLQSYGCK